MRRLFSVFLILVLSFSFLCAYAEESDNQYEFLISDWLVVYSQGGQPVFEMYLYIHEDGTFEQCFTNEVALADDGSNTVKGTWTFDGKILTLTSEDGSASLDWDEEAHQFTAEEEGVTITIKMPIEPES